MSKTHHIAVLPGDGIGPEIIEQAIKAIDATCKKYGHTVGYTYGSVGATAIDKTGNPYPEETHRICMQSDAVLFGAIGDPRFDNNPQAKVRPEQGLLEMRKNIILTISHDIRAPLNIISGSAELAMDTREKKRRNSHLNNIRIVCKHVVHLLNNLLPLQLHHKNLVQV